MARWYKQLGFAVALLILAAVIAFGFVSTRKKPERQARLNPGPLVDVHSVEQSSLAAAVTGNGTVRPVRTVQLVPQVTGKVIAVHRSLVSGGFFRQDEGLVIIEPTDYQLAVQRAEADLARARVQLELDRAEASVAREEWDELNPGQEPSSPLVLRKPQVDRSQAELQAAKANLASARLNLERTRLSLPFDGRVVSKTVDAGQFIVAGQPVAVVYGTARVEIPVPLEDSKLAWFDVPYLPPGASGRPPGAPAEVRAKVAGSLHTWPGRVVRTEGEIDRVTRMVSVVVEVEAPFAGAEGRPPLTPGQFVEVVIEGRQLEDVLLVPRDALHSGDRVWVVEGGQLFVRSVITARKDKQWAYVVSGIAAGDQVVVSPLEAVTDGMKVRVAEPAAAEGTTS